jgi:hypothetical protein
MVLSKDYEEHRTAVDDFLHITSPTINNTNTPFIADQLGIFIALISLPASDNTQSNYDLQFANGFVTSERIPSNHDEGFRIFNVQVCKSFKILNLLLSDSGIEILKNQLENVVNLLFSIFLPSSRGNFAHFRYL